jgi:hypothetical protein
VDISSNTTVAKEQTPAAFSPLPVGACLLFVLRIAGAVHQTLVGIGLGDALLRKTSSRPSSGCMRLHRYPPGFRQVNPRATSNNSIVRKSDHCARSHIPNRVHRRRGTRARSWASSYWTSEGIQERNVASRSPTRRKGYVGALVIFA